MAEALAEPPTSTSTPEFESWGRYPKYDANLIPLQWQGDYPDVATNLHDSALPVGMGRSYGDVCLLRGGNLLVTTGMNRLLAFDETTGVLTAEAGITLAQILDFCVPRVPPPSPPAPSTSRSVAPSPTTSTARITMSPAPSASMSPPLRSPAPTARA